MAVVARLISEAHAVVAMSTATCLRGYDLSDRHRMHLWDAMILAAAEEAGAIVLYTEDMPGAVNVSTGKIEAVTYIKPFAIPPARTSSP